MRADVQDFVYSRRAVVKTLRMTEDPAWVAELSKRKKLARKIAKLHSGKRSKKSFPSSEEILRADRDR